MTMGDIDVRYVMDLVKLVDTVNRELGFKSIEDSYLFICFLFHLRIKR